MVLVVIVLVVWETMRQVVFRAGHLRFLLFEKAVFPSSKVVFHDCPAPVVLHCTVKLPPMPKQRLPSSTSGTVTTVWHSNYLRAHSPLQILQAHRIFPFSNIVRDFPCLNSISVMLIDLLNYQLVRHFFRLIGYKLCGHGISFLQLGLAKQTKMLFMSKLICRIYKPKLNFGQGVNFLILTFRSHTILSFPLFLFGSLSFSFSLPLSAFLSVLLSIATSFSLYLSTYLCPTL